MQGRHTWRLSAHCTDAATNWGNRLSASEPSCTSSAPPVACAIARRQAWLGGWCTASRVATQMRGTRSVASSAAAACHVTPVGPPCGSVSKCSTSASASSSAPSRLHTHVLLRTIPRPTPAAACQSAPLVHLGRSVDHVECTAVTVQPPASWPEGREAHS